MNQECKIKEGKSVSQDYSLLFLMPALKLKVERKDKALRRYQPLIDAGILWSVFVKEKKDIKP